VFKKKEHLNVNRGRSQRREREITRAYTALSRFKYSRRDLIAKKMFSAFRFSLWTGGRNFFETALGVMRTASLVVKKFEKKSEDVASHTVHDTIINMFGGLKKKQ